MADETIDGTPPVTDEMIEQWADEAEAGYDVAALRKRGAPPPSEKGPQPWSRSAWIKPYSRL